MQILYWCEHCKYAQFIDKVKTEQGELNVYCSAKAE